MFNFSLEKIAVINNVVNILRIFILIVILLITIYFFRKRIFNKLNICLFSISIFLFFLPLVIKKVASIFYPKSNFALYFLEKDIKEEKLNNIKSVIDKENIPLKKGNIFIGDSRTYSYLYEVNLNEIDEVYATVSGASLEFKKDFAKALDKVNNNTDYKYNLIFNYGVNNLSEDWVNIYKDAIKKVDNKANILIVSVNPCNDKIAKYCRNNNIENLNKKLKDNFTNAFSNVRYCDTYTSFIKRSNYLEMIEKISGIHYTKEGTNLIYESILNCLKDFN